VNDGPPTAPNIPAAASSAEQLLPLVYEELRKLAAAKMAGEACGQTLQATALVHEAWLRLGGDEQPAWQNRAHFFAAAAEAMRRILINRARSRRAERHGGGQERLNADELPLAADSANDDVILSVNDALGRLAAIDAPKAELVKLRYFGGLTIEEAARTLEISEPTANPGGPTRVPGCTRRSSGRIRLGATRPHQTNQYSFNR
jgi:RNA polymerase sigma factor (TIGR02999 family)